MLLNMQGKVPRNKLIAISEQALEALRDVTPVRTGLTRASWYYEIQNKKNGATIILFNSNVQANGNVAILLDEGHGTGSGVWIQGLNYIDPAVRPVFEKAKNDIWKEMTDSDAEH